ncbi:MAG: HAD family hydrolase [Bacteroidota bacterium]
MKIAFLDRDGILNKEIGVHVHKKETFEILPDVIPALLELQRKGYSCVIVTNQSGIALGYYGHEDVHLLHGILREHLSTAGIELLDIFYCPHHPSKSKCLCRKPEGIMVEKGLAKYYADPTDCIMFGDRERDVQAANSAGVRGILLDSNSGLLKAIQQTDF